MDEHQTIFKLASIFLQYPDREWVENEALREEVASLKHRGVRECYLRFLDQVELDTLCESYVQTFDFSDKTTLYLTYPLFGDQRERGEAFLKLKKEFREAGFPLLSDELPDYLPLVLEFAAIADSPYSRKVLMIHKKGIDQLLEGLEEIDSPYQWVVRGCLRAIDSFLEENQVVS
ncbi:MAG: nitrate reductase molybdenum cofactor assembly chaperone [Firmicutes bacterium]|uniref:Respiratory nitrate reductase chaperone NarJ n=1 Tax=Melghirimyces thermohalophilus TaxID=1236220 RepID=A0A1G6PQ80_9BACL|nr:nitrate reductase molybdenum cofactor assembly chaperone [Melghirimyces thermohalophilus]MDA8352439.1 nitrate reductase molybdenum cofactor assembly chaperone [Bacillota bacterium]SDC81527.1 respiratory nitrate reductase chaperone NarJ [Melghirimyces thermohalophilus]